MSPTKRKGKEHWRFACVFESGLSAEIPERSGKQVGYCWVSLELGGSGTNEKAAASRSCSGAKFLSSWGRTDEIKSHFQGSGAINLAVSLAGTFGHSSSSSPAYK